MSVTGRTYTKTRPRGLAPWTPRAGARLLLGHIRDVLDEYADYLPVTNRQIFYRLVGAYGYEKTDRLFDQLGEVLNRARRSGSVPWSAIRDDRAMSISPECFTGPTDFWGTVQAWAEEYRRDPSMGQARP